MALNYDYYGKQNGDTAHDRLAEAGEYFSHRLYATAWESANDAEKEKALIAARYLIDSLNFKGDKTDVAQALEFPRGGDMEAPEAIRIAGYEIAYALLDGKDPELELENLAVQAMGYGAVKTSYERTGLPIEHIINMVPSSAAWRLLKPFLRDSDAIKLSRLS
ncbi:MAG: DnaT-like ssDNA-binding protein [Thermoguttaceae bacterium]